MVFVSLLRFLTFDYSVNTVSTSVTYTTLRRTREQCVRRQIEASTSTVYPLQSIGLDVLCSRPTHRDLRIGEVMLIPELIFVRED